MWDNVTEFKAALQYIRRQQDQLKEPRLKEPTQVEQNAS